MKRDLEMVRDILMEIENLPREQTLKVIDAIPEERRNYWKVLGLTTDEEELKCCDPVVNGGAMKDHRGGEKLCLSHKSG